MNAWILLLLFSLAITWFQGSESLDSTSKLPLQTLHVSVISKIVRLPENEAALSAYTIPAELPGKSIG